MTHSEVTGYIHCATDFGEANVFPFKLITCGHAAEQEVSGGNLCPKREDFNLLNVTLILTLQLTNQS